MSKESSRNWNGRAWDSRQPQAGCGTAYSPHRWHQGWVWGIRGRVQNSEHPPWLPISTCGHMLNPPSTWKERLQPEDLQRGENKISQMQGDKGQNKTKKALGIGRFKA